MKTWLVVTPEYGEVIPIVDGQGPMEYGADVIFVEAESKRDALRLGVKAMKKRGDHYFDDCDNPFNGVKVYEAQYCPHSRGEWERCLDCAREWAEEPTSPPATPPQPPPAQSDQAAAERI
jgi:hypothetical protein